MRPALAVLTLVSLIAVAAAPVPDPVLERVIAGARAVTPASIAFDRTVREVATEAGGKPVTRIIVDRWDGKQMTIVSIDGRPPTAAEAAAIAKANAGRPLSSYARVAQYLAGGVRRVADPQGRTVYRIEALPKGSVDIGRDVSASMIGEAVIDTSGPVPYVAQLRLVLAKPISFFLVAKLDALEIINEYRPGPGGRPALVRQIRTLSGAQFGKAGATRTEATLIPLL
jgi:hypothetical protein